MFVFNQSCKQLLLSMYLQKHRFTRNAEASNFVKLVLFYLKMKFSNKYHVFSSSYICKVSFFCISNNFSCFLQTKTCNLSQFFAFLSCISCRQLTILYYWAHESDFFSDKISLLATHPPAVRPSVCLLSSSSPPFPLLCRSALCVIIFCSTPAPTLPLCILFYLSLSLKILLYFFQLF